MLEVNPYGHYVDDKSAKKAIEGVKKLNGKNVTSFNIPDDIDGDNDDS